MQHYNSTPVSHPPEAIRCRRSKSPPTHGHRFRSAPPGLFPLSEPIPKENILPHTVPECPSHGAPPLRPAHTASHFLPLTHPGTRVPDPRLPESLPDFRCTLRGSPAPFGSGQAHCRCRPFPMDPLPRKLPAFYRTSSGQLPCNGRKQMYGKRTPPRCTFSAPPFPGFPPRNRPQQAPPDGRMTPLSYRSSVFQTVLLRPETDPFSPMPHRGL